MQNENCKFVVGNTYRTRDGKKELKLVYILSGEIGGLVFAGYDTAAYDHGKEEIVVLRKMDGTVTHNQHNQLSDYDVVPGKWHYFAAYKAGAIANSRYKGTVFTTPAYPSKDEVMSYINRQTSRAFGSAQLIQMHSCYVED